jgi:hypothetical protein
MAHYDIADPDDPNTLVVPFIFVPQGDPLPLAWMREHPDWIRVPATFVPREPAAGESGSQWNVQVGTADAPAATGAGGAAAPGNGDNGCTTASAAAAWRKAEAVAADPVGAIVMYSVVDAQPAPAHNQGSTFASIAQALLGYRSAQARAEDDGKEDDLSRRGPGGRDLIGAEVQARTGDVAATRPGAATPVPFVDSKGRAILNDQGQPMMRPAGMDPHFFVSQALKDEKQEEMMISSGGEGGGAAALGYQTSALSKFGRGAPWDAQRIGGSNHQEFVDYATVAIGLYAAANGISRDHILMIEDAVARTSHYPPKTEMDKTYPHLPTRTVHNTDLGYSLYQSGRIAATSKP